MSDELRNGLKTLAVFNLTLAATFFFTVAFFVVWLEYDYITTSSILFTVVLTVLVLAMLGDLIKAVVERDPGAVIAFVVFMLLTMGAVTAGLGVFTAIKHPEISDRYDMVSHFWGVMAWPFATIGHLLSGLVPAASSVIAAVGNGVGDAAGFLNPKTFVTQTLLETLADVLVKVVVFILLMSASLLLPKRLRRSLITRFATVA